ncbi:MAG: EAL domain-containing protein [Solirubrobacteraceae bacterium]|nr:EAL domain-containing protein [Solirubrobacteraceae bacterium]
MSAPMPTRASIAAEAVRALRGLMISRAPDWRRETLSVPIAVGFTLLYLGVAELSGQLITTVAISPWYPPAGLSLAAVLVFGLRGLPLVLVADALQLVVRGQDDLLASIAQGIAQALFWGGAGLLLRPKLLAESPLSRMRELAWFGAIGVVIAPLVAGALGVALIKVLNSSGWDDYFSTVQLYAIGDSIGVLSLTPTILVLSGWARRRAAAWRAVQHAVGGRGWEGWTMLLLTIGLPALSVVLWNGDLLAFAVLPVAWVAVRRGMPTAALALGAWSLSAVAGFAIDDSGGVTLREISALMISTGMLSLSAAAIVTERERGRARMAYLALHDDVTGLPNRLGFTEQVADALRRGDRDDVAVLHVRLQTLSSVTAASASEVIAPEALDRVLLRAAHRLRRLTGPDATIARIGTGRFVVLLDGPDAARVEAIAAHLVGGLARPAVVDGREYLFGPVIGSAVGSAREHPERVLEKAQLAADSAGPQTRNTAAYDEGMRRAADQSRELGEELRRAIDDGALHLCFQPIVAASDRRPLGAEALARWTHAERGPIGPNEFIPVAEACGLILPLGRWVLQDACRQAAGWPAPAPGDAPLVVHVNLSPVQLRDEGLVAFVADTLRASNLPAHRLCLELTESALFDDLDVAAGRVEELTALGVAVVLDDFGTGASSLSWLQRLPVTALKIDRSFVSKIEEHSVDEAIVSATLGLARAIDLDTVAEGVETEAQLASLLALGCSSIQGFLICRPIPGDALLKWLSTPVIVPLPAPLPNATADEPAGA